MAKITKLKRYKNDFEKAKTQMEKKKKSYKKRKQKFFELWSLEI